MAATLRRRIEQYYDAVPRTATRVETLGPFTLFINHGGGWPYYARPTPGATSFTLADVERVRARQRALKVPESFEWVAETTPALHEPILASGLRVRAHPLLVLDPDAPRAVPSPGGVSIRLVREDDDLGRIKAVGRLAFGAPGTAVGATGIEAFTAADSALALEVDRERLRSGLTVTAAAFTPDGYPVASGAHQPLAGVSEIVGVGTLPAFRRRGIGAAVTAVLLDDALRRAQVVFLSADDSTVARIYERLGFRPLATACVAEPA